MKSVFKILYNDLQGVWELWEYQYNYADKIYPLQLAWLLHTSYHKLSCELYLKHLKLNLI